MWVKNRIDNKGWFPYLYFNSKYLYFSLYRQAKKKKIHPLYTKHSGLVYWA
nr:MAG TPA: hypothetical protein [Caudoviricetes sp.]